MRFNNVLMVVLLGLVNLSSAENLQQEYQLQEERITDPQLAPIDWDSLRLLSERLFALDWVDGACPEWGAFPAPSTASTTYGSTPQGVSLFRVTAKQGQLRPGWTYWKERGVSGVHVEKCVPGNWVVSTFTVDTPPVIVPAVPVVHTQVVEREVEVPGETVYVDRPVYVERPTRQYIPPPVITPLATTGVVVDMGSISVGPWRNLAIGTVAFVPSSKAHKEPSEPEKPPVNCGQEGGPKKSEGPGVAGDTDNEASTWPNESEVGDVHVGPESDATGSVRVPEGVDAPAGAVRESGTHAEAAGADNTPAPPDPTGSGTTIEAAPQ